MLLTNQQEVNPIAFPKQNPNTFGLKWRRIGINYQAVIEVLAKTLKGLADPDTVELVEYCKDTNIW